MRKALGLFVLLRSMLKDPWVCYLQDFQHFWRDDPISEGGTMLGSQNQHGQPRIGSFRFVISIHGQLACGISCVFGNYSEIKRAFVEESTIHVVFFLEQTLWHRWSVVDRRHLKYYRHAGGISTATSITHGSSSKRLTATLLIQLPTIAIFAGFSNATFQLASSVGPGKG
jgi:hypothetical protein